MKFNRRLIEEIKQSPLLIGLSISLGLMGGIMAIFQARQISIVINQSFLAHQPLPAVYSLLVGILVIIVLRSCFSWCGEALAGIAARQIKQDLRQRLFTHIFDIGPAYLKSGSLETQVRTGELVNTAIEGIDALEVYFSQYLPQLALAALVPLAILFFVFPIDLLSGVIFLVTAPLLPIFMFLIGSAAETLTRKQWQGLSRMSAYFLDVLQGLTTLKYLGRSRDQVEQIKQVSENYRKTTMSVLRVTFLSALVLELIATLSTAIVAVEIGIRLLYGQLQFGQAFFLLLLAPEFYQPLRLLGTRFHAGMAGVEAGKRIYEIMDFPSANDSPTPLQPLAAFSHPPSLSLRDVHFAYSDEHLALQEVSLDVLPGKMTALVGESGAGKTTLTWLILRFLQPQAGRILVDGVPLDDIPKPQWLESLAWVPQNPYLFSDTIVANIKMAKPDADEAAIRLAAQQAHADEFICQLPQGYQTQIGERGVKLSAGQAQRIALARAFLKNAPFLILDEATSHLDPETDTLVRRSMQKLCSGRTVLAIAHRQNTLAMADQVVRMDQGKVIAITQPARHVPSSLVIEDASQPPLDTSHFVHLPLELSKFAQAQPGIEQKEPVELRLIKLLAPFGGRVLLSVFLGFATIASSIGLMATAAYIISAAALRPSIAELEVAIVGVRFFGLSRGIFRYLERLVSHDTTLRLLARWRTWFYQALEPMAPAGLMDYHSGDLLARVINDIGSLENFYVRSIAPPLVAVLVGVTTCLLMGNFGAPLAWLLVIFIGLAGIGLPSLALVLSRWQGPLISLERARLSTLLVDGIQGMADLLACAHAARYLEKVRLASDKLSRLQTRMALISSMLNTLVNLLANLGMLFVLALAIQRVTSGVLNGVYLGVVALIALTCFEAMQPLPLSAQYYAANRAAAARLYQLVDAVPPVTEPAEPLVLPSKTDLEVRGVSFQYPLSPGAMQIANPPPFSLQDISFSLPAGKHIAIIGKSGAGKTSLINLILRFWEYQRGSILMGGNELRKYRQEDLHRRIALVSQSTYLFSATIKENLLMAHPHATDEAILQAARQSRLHDFVVSLPDGYNTWIGEHGLRLSGGERQRLAIARALLSEAPIIVLDEPTANLDQDTERAVLASVRAACQGRSTITITQSMEGLEAMDEILVLKSGCIIEKGSHHQLISSQGVYKRMWDLYHQRI